MKLSPELLDHVRVMRRKTLETACESALKQGVYEVSSRYIKASLDINKVRCRHATLGFCCNLIDFVVDFVAPGGKPGEDDSADQAVGELEPHACTACRFG